jgi:hypothetical protein
MKFWKSVIGFFTGNSGGKIIDVADKLHHSAQERAEGDAADLKDARAMPMLSGGETWFDVLVNACNRAVRPGITLWLVGGFVGWWQLPPPDDIDPFWQQAFLIVLTFWFGGRMLLKDLPAAIRAIRAIKAIRG